MVLGAGVNLAVSAELHYVIGNVLCHSFHCLFFFVLSSSCAMLQKKLCEVIFVRTSSNFY